jgi:hypothetical protein
MEACKFTASKEQKESRINIGESKGHTERKKEGRSERKEEGNEVRTEEKWQDNYRCIPSALRLNVRKIPLLWYERFLPNLFQFIIHVSLCHSTLYTNHIHH